MPNRKLVVVPKRPRSGAVPLLAHLSGTDAPKQFGVYNTLAVMAYLLRSVPSDHDWAERVAALLGAFPSNEHLDLSSMGVGGGWLDRALWTGRYSSRWCPRAGRAQPVSEVCHGLDELLRTRNDEVDR